MIVKITSKRQVTLPAHVLDAMGVGPGDRRCNSYQVPTDTFSGPGALTTRAWALSGEDSAGPSALRHPHIP